ncbi:MAG: LytTR family DNA-binding domain-containing protein [Gammaproteobacteria bacterium]
MSNEMRAETSKLLVKVGRHIRVVNLTNILYIHASGDYVDIVLATGEIIHTKDKITHFECRLPTRLFVRIHRSFIVNKDYIREIKAKQNNYGFTLANDVVIISGPTYRKYVRERFILNLDEVNPANWAVWGRV